MKSDQRPSQTQAERRPSLENGGGIGQPPQLPRGRLGWPCRWARRSEVGERLWQRCGQPLRETPAQPAHRAQLAEPTRLDEQTGQQLQQDADIVKAAAHSHHFDEVLGEQLVAELEHVATNRLAIHVILLCEKRSVFGD